MGSDAGSEAWQSAAWRGRVRPGLELEVESPDELARLLAPERSLQTVYWGRNYLYRIELPTVTGPVAAVVKQFRHDTWRKQWSRRQKGSKAERSYRVARFLEAAGLATPEPLLFLESRQMAGPSYYLTRLLPDALEARYFIRAMNDGSVAERFPDRPVADFLECVASTARRIHDAGVWHRDYSAGNLLLTDGPLAHLVDLNRARVGRPVRFSERLRDLSRLPLERREDQRELLRRYFEGSPPVLGRLLYAVHHRAFHGRHRAKKQLRGWRRSLVELFVPRRAYPHLPVPPPSASARDKAVWDHLSDQPHQHATRWEKARIRLVDAPHHLRELGAALVVAPRALAALRSQTPRELMWPGAGVGTRPSASTNEVVHRGIVDLGVRRVLVRLHPWEEDHGPCVEAVEMLRSAGLEVVFAVPQIRDLVRDRVRWRAGLERIAATFGTEGQTFQVGQAINRSKWGVWSLREYETLLEDAFELLRPARIVGPAVIDFEPVRLAGVLHALPQRLRVDAVTSLLYVDRRGAPERRQLGCDAAGKARLVAAIARTSRAGSDEVWITEVNWPLLEGPHAPAGRDVAVDEESQASYLVRYYVAVFATGVIARVYWWQVLAQGYGLIAGDGRRRPAFAALATMERLLGGARLIAIRQPVAGAFEGVFERGEGERLVVAWRVEGWGRIDLGARPRRVIGRDGEELPRPETAMVDVGPAPRYFVLDL